jgi:hypothetical protein
MRIAQSSCLIWNDVLILLKILKTVSHTASPRKISEKNINILQINKYSVNMTSDVVK